MLTVGELALHDKAGGMIEMLVVVEMVAVRSSGSSELDLVKDVGLKAFSRYLCCHTSKKEP